MLEFMSYEVVLGIHIITFVCNIILVIIADGLGALWVLGRKETLNAVLMKRLHVSIWIGLSISIVTGIILFSTLPEYLLTVSAFYTKLFFVGALIINSVGISKHLHIPSEKPFSVLTRREKLPLFMSGAISTTCWIGVVVSATFLGL